MNGPVAIDLHNAAAAEGAFVDLTQRAPQALFPLVSEQFAGFAIDKMSFCAGWAEHHLILIYGCAVIDAKPMLNTLSRLRTRVD